MYRPNGTPLTDHEREVLVIFVEECNEAAQAACKLIRFGKDNRPDTGVSNVETLSYEVGDLLCMIEIAKSLSLMTDPSIHNGTLMKREKLAHFMQTVR